MKKIIAAALLMLAVASPANAGNAGLGTVSGLISTEFEIQFFNTNGQRAGTPSCVGAGLQPRWAISVGNDAGKTMMAVLLTAIARGKKVAVNGTGTCSIWGDTEMEQVPVPFKIGRAHV